MTTRKEHMDWCKQRAMELVEEGDYIIAVASMMSDLSKHEETQELGATMAPLAMHELLKATPESIRHFIDGFQ